MLKTPLNFPSRLHRIFSKYNLTVYYISKQATKKPMSEDTAISPVNRTSNSKTIENEKSVFFSKFASMGRENCGLGEL